MRICYTAFDVVPSPKGASVHITHFVRGLVGAGHAVDLLTAGDGVLPAEEEYEGARVLRVPPGDDMNFLVRAVAFGEFVQSHLAAAAPYQVVHYRSIWGGLPLTRARHRHGYRTLFEVNGLPSVELKYHYPDLRDSPLVAKLREQELATLALSDVVVCPSDVTRAFLVSLGVPRSRIRIIRNGFSTRHFSPTPLPSLNGDTVPTVVYVGTLADWQGLETLVDAMRLVLAQHPAHLQIIGRGRKRQRKALAKRIHKLGLEQHIEVQAAVPHHAIAALIAGAHVCVAPLALNDRNLVQGCCPIKVIEYMAAGRPVVAANLPVVRELVYEGRDGLLFAPGDAHDLARQILAVLDDGALAQRLAESAAERAHANFTWHEAEKKLLRVYEELLLAADP
jgi:glycosyltransferase involved in cell wall biosynthesis